MGGMKKLWLIAMCVLGGVCPAAGDAVSLLCPVVQEDKKADKEAVALAKSLQALDKTGVDARNKTGQTALMAAAEQDNRLVVAYLVALGADVGVADKSGKTALSYAKSAPVRELLSVCQANNTTMLHEDKQKLLREKGLQDAAARMDHVKLLVKGNKLREVSDILRLGVALDEEGAPALHTTASITPEMLALLVRRGYNVNTPSADTEKVHLPATLSVAKLALALGQKPTEELATAVLTNDVVGAKKLLGADPKLTESICAIGRSPLYLVQSAEMVRALKAAGADIKAASIGQGGEPKEPLLNDIIANQTAGAREAEVVQALIDSGAVVEDSPHLLKTLCAEGSASARTAQCLINAGAKPEGTELHYAAARGKTPLVKLLIENKMNPNATDSNGDTPLHFLLKNAHQLCPNIFILPGTIKALIKGGANPKLKTKDGQNALQLAKSLGFSDNLAKAIKAYSK